MNAKEVSPADEMDVGLLRRGDGMLPIVGLGGSAGGIAALQQFFAAMPADSGMAFVVILHLSATHESTLAEIFQLSTTMPVVAATDEVTVEPNSVYVIPPGKFLVSVDGHLRLTDAEEHRGKRVAVDYFFRTLAETHGAQALAVVLSGAGGDGALGLKRVKELGGLTIAQDPDEAEHPDMPRSAIATGVVDWVLGVKEMPAKLLAYVKQRGKLNLPGEEGPHPAETVKLSFDEHEGSLRDVLAFLHTRTGRDFSCYKRATILRRIARRMQVNGLADLPGYLVYLRTHAGEAGALLRDLLISVTNFFRDPESFAALERIIPALFKDKAAGDTVRVWVAGCATGEEAYSVAMLLSEHAATLVGPPQLQVFATDLDEEVIREAREGLYPETIAADVSDERLRHFFIHEQGGYRVRRAVRELVLFAPHDLLKDSPFSRLDLVSCRNLLIYLNREAQTRAFDIFHFALRPGGRLFLGTSEAVDEGSPLFAVLDKKQRLYIQRPGPQRLISVPAHLRDTIEEAEASTEELKASNEELQAMNEELRSATEELETSREELQSINEELTTVNDELKSNVDQLARSNSDLQNLMAATDIATVFLDRGLRVQRFTPAAKVLFNFISTDLGRPLSDLSCQLDYPEVVADAERSLAHLQPAEREVAAGERWYIARTLPYRTADDHIAGVVLTFLDITTQKESENALRASEERFRATFEHVAVGIAHVGLDGQWLRVNGVLCDILGFSRAELLHRTFQDITHPDDLAADLDEVARLVAGEITTHAMEKRYIRRDGSHLWADLTVSLVRTADGRPAHFIFVIEDITDRKQAEQALRVSEERLKVAAEAGQVGIWDWNLVNDTLIWDDAMFALYGARREDFSGAYDAWAARLHPEDKAASEAAAQDAVAGRKDYPIEFRVNWPDGSVHHIEAHGRVIHDEAGQPVRMIGTNVDITERKLRERNLVFLADIQKVFATLTSSTEIKRAASERLAEHLGLIHCTLVEVDEPADTWTVLHDHNAPGTRNLAGDYRLSDFHTEEERRVLASGAPLVIANVRDGGRPAARAEHFEALGIRAVLNAGYVTGGRWRFVLHASRAEPYAWPAEEVELLTELAARVYIRVERARAEEASCKNEERLRLAVAVTGLGVSEIDYGTHTVVLDGTAAALFGLEPRVPLPRSAVHDRFHPDDQAEVTRLMDGCLGPTGDGTFSMDHRVVLPDGSARWLSVKKVVTFEDVAGVRRPVAGLLAAVDITARKQSEIELRDGEQRMRVATEATGVGIWQWNVVTGQIRWDARMFVIYGIAPTPDGFVDYSDWSGAVLPEDLPESEAILQDTVRRCGQSERTFRIRRRDDGECRQVAAVETVRMNAQGQAEWVVGTNLDITERKRTEEALLAHHKHARLVSDVSARLVLRSRGEKRESVDELLKSVFTDVARHLDVEYYFNFVENDEPGMLRLVSCQGLDREARAALAHIRFGEHLCGLVAQSRQPLVVEDLQNCPLENAAAVCAMGARTYAGYPMLTGERLIGTISFATARRLRFTGEELELIQTVADLIAAAVERDRLALSVREAEELFRTLADNIPQLAWIADAGTDGQVHWFNRNWFEYTGTTFEEMRGSGWHTVHHPDHAASVIQKFQHHVKAGLDWEDTFPLRGKDGQFRWFLSRMKVIRDESGTVVRIFGTNTDITEARDTAEDLRRLTAELFEAARRKDEFLATLAHELRNPLAPIRNGLQVMRLSGSDDGIVAEVRSMMERQLNQMIRLVDDLLDVSRITRDNLKLKKQQVELATVVRSAVETSRPLIEQADHTITVTVPQTPIYLEADLTRLAQVFSNLLNNSAKYTPAGGRIWLVAEGFENEVTVTVGDNGLGIPAESLPQIFQMFSQVDRNMEMAQGGLGIGLALVRRLIEMHGGTVEARSDGPGQGSEFTVRLPVLKLTQQPVTIAGNEIAMAKAQRRILVVDDNQDSAKSLALMLNLMGNAVHMSHDGLAAVHDAEHFRPDLILLDIGLPKLNGYDACRRIREQSWSCGMVIVALTGWGKEDDRRRSKEAGFDHHLVKPVDLAALDQLLAAAKPQTHSLQHSNPTQTSLRVLVVDDRRDATHMLRTLLTKIGHDVQTAADGPSALALALDFRPEVVFLDISMPGMSGLEVAKRIRQQSILQGIVLIAMTGHGDDEDRQSSIEAGFDFHLVKPADIKMVYEILATIK